MSVTLSMYAEPLNREREREENLREFTRCCSCTGQGWYRAARNIPGAGIKEGEWYCKDCLDEALHELCATIRREMEADAVKWMNDFNDEPEYYYGDDYYDR